MTKIKIYDYTHKMKGMYFIRQGMKVVLVDINNNTIRCSGKSLKLLLIFISFTVKEVKQGTGWYDHIIEKYGMMVGSLIYISQSDKKLNKD